MRRLVTVLGLVLAGAIAGCASSVNAITALEKVKPEQVAGAKYHASGLSGTPTDGDSVGLSCDASGNLLVSASLGSSTASIGTVSLSIAYVDSDVATGDLTSNGATLVTIAPAVSGKTIWVRGSFQNTSTTTAYPIYLHNTNSGHKIDTLGPIPAGGSGWWQVGDGEHGEQGQGLSFSTTSGGAGNLTGDLKYAAK